MFDVGFTELLVIAVVALLVLGPERLPGAARTAGSFLRKARDGWNSVRGEFERQVALDEVKRSVGEVRAAVESSARAAAAPAAPAPTPSTPDGAPQAEPAPGMAPVPARAPHD
jgi:sec-independent protein translocase protein TatB